MVDVDGVKCEVIVQGMFSGNSIRLGIVVVRATTIPEPLERSHTSDVFLYKGTGLAMKQYAQRITIITPYVD